MTGKNLSRRRYIPAACIGYCLLVRRPHVRGSVWLHCPNLLREQAKEVERLNGVYNKLLKDTGVELIGECGFSEGTLACTKSPTEKLENTVCCELHPEACPPAHSLAACRGTGQAPGPAHSRSHPFQWEHTEAHRQKNFAGIGGKACESTNSRQGTYMSLKQSSARPCCVQIGKMPALAQHCMQFSESHLGLLPPHPSQTVSARGCCRSMQSLQMMRWFWTTCQRQAL